MSVLVTPWVLTCHHGVLTKPWVLMLLTPLLLSRSLVNGGRGVNTTPHFLQCDARFKGLRTLSVGWIDFEKAYNRVPHEWVTSVLDTIHAPRWVRTTVGRLPSGDDLRRLSTAGKAVSQIEGMQRSVLCSSVRILRGHLSACGLAA